MPTWHVALFTCAFLISAEDEEASTVAPEDDYESDENDNEDNAAIVVDGGNSYVVAPSGRKWSHDPLQRKSRCFRFRPDSTVGPRDSRFDDIFNSRIKNEILKWTNAKAVSVFERCNANGQTQRAWTPMSLSELDAYLGILLYIGALRAGHRRLRTLWDPVLGHAYICAAMNYTRFEMINNFLRFDDSIARRGQAAAERHLLQPVQLLIDGINNSLQSMYNPGGNLTIDEQLKAFGGRCKFRQNMPSTPAKYGLRFWWLTDSASAYPLKFAIDTGGSDASAGHGRGYDVATHLMSKYLHTGRNLTIDKYFTSIELARKLLRSQTTILGTMRKNKRDVPQSFVMKEVVNKQNKPVKKNNRKTYRPVHSSMFGFSEKFAMVSYVPRPNECIVLLSTRHNLDKATSGAQNKPEMILDYDHTKGGDLFDQMLSAYSCSLPTNRWPMVVFYNLLDAVALATVIINRHFHSPRTTKKLYRNDKLIQIARMLMESEIYERSQPRMHKLIGKSAVEALKTIGRVARLPPIYEGIPTEPVRYFDSNCI